MASSSSSGAASVRRIVAVAEVGVVDLRDAGRLRAVGVSLSESARRPSPPMEAAQE